MRSRRRAARARPDVYKRQLSDLAAEREALSARLEKALSDNSEIIAKEGSLADTLKRIEDNRTEYSRTKKLCELYDSYIAHTRFEMRIRDRLCAVSFLLQRYARKSPSPILMSLLSAGLGIVFYGLL